MCEYACNNTASYQTIHDGENVSQMMDLQLYARNGGDDGCGFKKLPRHNIYSPIPSLIKNYKIIKQ